MPDANPKEQEMLKAALAKTGACLPMEALAEAAENSEFGPRSLEAREHLSTCPRCRNEVALLRQFQMAAPEQDEVSSIRWIESELQRRAPEIQGAPAMQVPGSKPQRESGVSWLAQLFSTRHWRMASLVAASLLMMVGARVYLRQEAQRVSDIDPTVWRSGRITVVSPAREVLAAPADFAWQPVEGAARYRIQVMEVDRTVIWTAENSATRIPTPSSLKQRMTPGRTFTWEVIALNAAGEKIAGADPQTLRIPATAK